MENLNLTIGLVEPNCSNAELIKTLFKSQEKYVENVEIIPNREVLFQMIKDGDINTLVINIFGDDILKKIGIIQDVQQDKTIPICLLGTSEQIKHFEGAPSEWKNKFKSYCKIAIDISPQDLNKEIEEMAKGLFRCREGKILKVKLDNVIASDKKPEEKVKELLELPGKAVEFGKGEQILNNEELLKAIEKSGNSEKEKEKAIVEAVGKAKEKIKSEQKKDERKNEESSKGLVEEVMSKKDLEDLVKRTLNDSAESIKLYKKVNVIIVAIGLALVIVSMIYFLIYPNNPAILGFGGLGLAGVIASLITAPVASIGKTARQMVQIQICYFGYLKQIKILDDVKEDAVTGAIEISKRLESVTNSLPKSLCENFDPDSMEVYKSQIALIKKIGSIKDSTQPKTENT